MPFLWGAGGAKLTPDQIALRQKQAMYRGDYSPVQSWAQGLGRVADGLVSGLDLRALDKQAASVETDTQSVIAQLAGGATAPDPNIVVQGLASRDPRLHDLAEKQWDLTHPKPRAPTELEQLGTLAGLTPDQIKQGAGQAFHNKIDPLVNFVAGGNTVAGPRSLVEQQFGMSGQGGNNIPMGNPLSPPSGPPAEAVAYLRSNPTLAADFDAKYGAGSAQQILGGR